MFALPTSCLICMLLLKIDGKLYLQDRETVLMAIRYKSDWLFFDYVDNFNAKQSIRVQSNLLRDGNWHDLIVAVSEEEVTIIWDCSIPIRR